MEDAHVLGRDILNIERLEAMEPVPELGRASRIADFEEVKEFPFRSAGDSGEMELSRFGGRLGTEDQATALDCSAYLRSKSMGEICPRAEWRRRGL